MKFPCRLDKFISHLTELPRTKTKAGIKRKYAKVNGTVITSFDYQVTESDVVLWQDKQLEVLGDRYFMLNKPEGYVCATSDELHQTVLELLDEPVMSKLHIAGRLDLDTTGLVLITNDGEWSHKVTSPKYQKYKTYLVETLEPMTDDALQELRDGVQLHGEKGLTQPAIVELLAEYSVRISICEGKYHQVKRMFAAVGNKVEVLHREKIAGITLDQDLAPGQYRLLTAEEIHSI
ncbi:16S rRNA pseudouridine(516) synthase RsuA [Pseudoalteromonas tunicata]|jgi:16S rRNA pseudouridine516 synthase|uniref:Pseudouridine synthase n=1 Tax=Pseudoalteromonas tunicata D2 TaxID=87626 RepID=A4C7N0_9GAMM|nr:16S rRNA pseudouridine(516) synthase RsuA [Pseudoalteromonas tunicata]ATC95955.1 16S rRNA pseudouridine516 synthase [Pseudoalteromonas tunicata]AXT31491.1 16S rRNA pseudouridine(516) synthase RsuA [Pseudoalteromonas tunicata]EAR29984.1 16S rRNA pseudouridylate 516 synthase [Pseudoalteromonas tunicata D2]